MVPDAYPPSPLVTSHSFSESDRRPSSVDSHWTILTRPVASAATAFESTIPATADITVPLAVSVPAPERRGPERATPDRSPRAAYRSRRIQVPRSTSASATYSRQAVRPAVRQTTTL